MAVSRNTTLVDHVVPSSESFSLNLLKDAVLVIVFSLLVAASAQFSFYLPFDPLVPVTLQTLAVLLTGAALGSRRGGLALLAYLAEGAAGLHFFAGGKFGFLILIGPTAGYLWSYPIAAFVTGLLCERRLERSYLTSVLAMLPGSLIIYLLGVTWLSAYFNWNFALGITKGLLPFIPGDIFKLLVAAALLPTAWLLVKTFRPDRPR